MVSSLDGFIARKDNSVSWLESNGSVYEAGVSVIDEDLTIRCHRAKYFNDFFVALDGDSILLLRDHETEWRMQLAGENKLIPR